jgi:anti-sigma28 factor (negative regulator of flagellin synthesis)
MISQANSSSVRATYASNLGESKSTKASANTSVSKQGDTSKIDRIKDSLASGEYKVDLEALSKKIAEELLQ